MLKGLNRQRSLSLYSEVLKSGDAESIRRLCREDLFFLILCGCKRQDINRDWLFDRCREVQESPDENLDLWARDHYKSTIITYGKTIQDILRDPEETVAIFSHTRPIAKSFLYQIKTEFEINTFLKSYFPDILWTDPQKESPRWSLDDGIIVKRKSNPKESTIEAWGLVDGQPTSKHYTLLVYDDMVTKESVSTPDMIEKVTYSWALSQNLGSDRPDHPCRRRYIGTRYHMADTYREIINRQAAKPRYHYPTDLGKDDIDVLGTPLLLTLPALIKKRKDFGPYVYSSQMLQNPSADKTMGFKEDWLQFYNILRNHLKWNFYLLVDPASAKKKHSDYTVMVVIALAPDNNYYLVDGIRDRLNLTERAAKVFEFVRKWPIKKVGYEQYGMQADIEHIQYVQQQEGFRFAIQPLGGAMTKEDRIRKLVPIFENGRFYIPRRLTFINNHGQMVDFIKILVDEEYLDFPVSQHDDMMDCIARITESDLGAAFPKLEPSAMPSMTQVAEDKPYNVLTGNTQGAKLL